MIGQPSTNRREPSASPSLARARLATMAWLHAFACAVIAARVVTLEWSSGDERRAEAVKPLTRAVIEAAPRGRSIAPDCTVLAHDVPGTALTVHYRWFEEPINAGW